MVAKACWLTIEPEISLEGFLASEETDFFPPKVAWIPEDLAVCIGDPSDSCVSDDAD